MPSSTNLTFTDPDEYHPAIRNMVEGVVTERGRYSAELTCIDLNQVWMTRGNESLARVWTFTPNVERAMIFFATDQNQPAMHVAGIDVPPDEATVISFGFSGHLTSPAASRWGGISLSLRDLANAGTAINGRELIPSTFAHRVKPSAPLLLRLRNLHEAAGHLAKTAPDILVKPEVARAMDEALTEAMVSCLASGEPAETYRSYSHHATVMRRFEEAVQADPEGPLYMTELCAALGVSYWTLRACCQEHLGMSPKRYLLLRRMDLARQALRRVNPGSITVTEIATNYGFWELGRFSVMYRSLFGESPSTTLCRRPDDPGPGEIAGSPRQFPKTA